VPEVRGDRMSIKQYCKNCGADHSEGDMFAWEYVCDSCGKSVAEAKELTNVNYSVYLLRGSVGGQKGYCEECIPKISETLGIKLDEAHRL
jgi:hypothetical protein